VGSTVYRRTRDCFSVSQQFDQSTAYVEPAGRGGDCGQAIFPALYSVMQPNQVPKLPREVLFHFETARDCWKFKQLYTMSRNQPIQLFDGHESTSFATERSAILNSTQEGGSKNLFPKSLE
jgi:hypothetical protein